MDWILFEETNPWKKNKAFLPPNLIPRKISRRILATIDEPFITVLLGPRRSGKSTLLWQIIDKLINKKGVSPQHIHYFSFDDVDVRADFKTYQSFSEICQIICGKRLFEVKEKTYFFIDEVQKVPEFFEVLKIVYDRFKGKIKFVISGSASLEVTSRVSGVLAGRVDYYRLNPFALGEIREIPHDSILLDLIEGKLEVEDLANLQSQLLPHHTEFFLQIKNALIYGLLPEVVLCENEEGKRRYLRNYRISYLEKDIRTLEQIGNLEEYIKVMDSIILNIGGILKISDISRQVGAAVNTVRKYLSILEETYVIQKLNCYHKNPKRRIIKSPKILLFDNGLYSLSTGIYSLPQYENTGLVGRLFENLVINEILKHIFIRGSQINTYFWRTSSGAEVDLVLERGGEIFAVEIKYKKEVDRKDISHLRKFASDYSDSIKSLFLIYNGLFRIVEDVICLPVWMV